MTSRFEWDVFLSHSSDDKPRVGGLARRLVDAGIKVWFDRQRLDEGRDIVQAIEEGLEQSRVLILCVTKRALQSEWVRVERNTAMFRDPENRERRFLPVLFEDCMIPGMLRRVKFVDWRSESDDAWNHLLSRLKPGADPAPELPIEEWNPFDPYMPALGDCFIGRSAELRRLLQAMEKGHSVSIVGDRRIGKTSLLAAFAEKSRHAGRIVRQLSGNGPEGASLPAFVREITGRECLPQKPGARDNIVSEADTAADHLREWAERNSQNGLKPVLIVDEAERLIETFPHRFFERIRGMLERLMVVFCSRRELDQVYNAHGRTSPFSNTLEMIRVALLETDAVEEVLDKAHGVFSQEHALAVREWSGRHPYFLQLLASELWDVVRDRMPMQNAIDRFNDSSAARLRELWQTLSSRDRNDLRKIAAGLSVTRRSLRLRGLVTDNGEPFGRVLREWLEDASP